MFLDFNELINNKNNEKDIPAVVLDYMSAELPGNLFYESDGNGIAYISGFQKVSGLLFDIPDELREEVGDNDISVDDILLYSYNSQELLKLKPVKEGFVKVDNEEIALNKFVKTINVDYKIENGCFYIIPSAFPKNRKIELSNDDYTKEMTFERVPYKSIKYMKFKAYCKGLMLMMLIPFSESNKASLKISYIADELSNYKELIECISLYSSITKGEGKINNITLKASSRTNNVDYSDLLTFLNKVESIENILSKKFDLYTGDISYGLARKVEGLYQNLINYKPIKNYRKIESITFEDEPQNISSENQKYAFLYKTNISHDILGCKFELPAIICIYAISCKLKQYKEAWKADIIYDSESYSTVMCFKDIADLNKFADNFKDAVTKMNNYVDVNNLLP